MRKLTWLSAHTVLAFQRLQVQVLTWRANQFEGMRFWVYFYWQCSELRGSRTSLGAKFSTRRVRGQQHRRKFFTRSLSKKISCPSHGSILCNHIQWHITLIQLSWCLTGKESSCPCKRRGFDPWVGKIPWRRKWQPIPVFLPGEFHGQRNLVGYSPRACKELGMT